MRKKKIKKEEIESEIVKKVSITIEDAINPKEAIIDEEVKEAIMDKTKDVIVNEKD